MQRRRYRRLSAGAALAVLLAGCSTVGEKSVTGTSRPPTSASRGSFVATWVPPNINPTVSQAKVAELTWSSPSGGKGSVPVTEGIAFSGRGENGAAITLLAARASAYPSAYWPAFLSSPDYRHRTTGSRVILYSPTPYRDLVQAMFEDDGYFVQVTAKKLTVDEVVEFAGDLRFSTS